MDINLRIAGEAGQGVVALGEILIGALAGAGLQVLAGKSYMSRVRGGLNWSDIRIGDCELHGLKVRAELLTVLTPEALDVLWTSSSPVFPSIIRIPSSGTRSGCGLLTTPMTVTTRKPR